MQNGLGDSMQLQCKAFKSLLRSLHKQQASLEAAKAEVAAGRQPFGLGRLSKQLSSIKPHTGSGDLDSAATAFAADSIGQSLDSIAARFIQAKDEGVALLKASITAFKQQTAPAALTAVVDTMLQGSEHAQAPEILAMLQTAKDNLQIDLVTIENQLQEGATVRQAKLLSAVERRTQQQHRQQQRQQASGLTAEAIATLAAAAAAAAATSAVPPGGAPVPQQPPPPPPPGAGDAGTGAGDAAMLDADLLATQPMHGNQEQQQEAEQAHAASHAAMTPNQVSAAIQAGLHAGITSLLQQVGLQVPPVTPPQAPPSRPRNRQPVSGRGSPQSRPQQQQQPNRPRQQQQQPRRRTTQQQRSGIAPNGPAPRQQAQPGRDTHRHQQQQQQQQPHRRPNAAAGRANANAGSRRTGNGGNNTRQGRQHSH
jgi:hypothetical protein